jgi:hypothetical protein
LDRTAYGYRHFDWGSGSDGRFGAETVLSFEESSEAGTEVTVDDGSTILKQEISARSGPPHLLRFVHAAVDAVSV